MKYKTFGKVIVFLSLMALVFIYCSVFTKTTSQDTTLDVKYSENAILLSLDTQEVIFSKNEKEMIAPASLTKIMTAIIVIEECLDLQETATISLETRQIMLAQNASVAGFEVEERVPIMDLLHGLLLSSGGECGLTLANRVASSEKKFVTLMNNKAKTLGLRNTHFTNVNGFDDANHYASVEDMATILQYALQNPVFYDIFTTLTYITQPTTFHQNGITLTSTLLKTNTSLTIPNGRIIGGKTGFTDNAGLCLASLANINGTPYIFISARAKGDSSSSPYHLLEALQIYEKLS